MNRDEALRIIQAALETLNSELPEDERFPLTPDVRLFGADSLIDSLSLVSLIVDVEADVSGVEGREISLSDAQAVARDPSPFSTPEALADYIVELTAEA